MSPARDRGQRDPLPPMPVIGENRPDVEDTTVEELRRQQKEAQAALDRRQADLDRVERRLAQRHGRSSVERELDLAQQHRATRSRDGLRGSPLALWSALAAVVLLLGATITSGIHHDEQGWEDLAATDAARVAWLDVSVAAHQAWASTESGDQLTPRAGGDADPLVAAQEAGALAGSYDQKAQILAATAEGLGAPPGSSSAVASWTTVHTVATGVIEAGAVSDAFTALARQGSGPFVALALGGLGLLIALTISLRLRAWWQGAALAAALVLALTTLVRMDAQALGAYWEEAGAHRTSQQQLTALVEQLHTDISRQLGDDPDGAGADQQSRAQEAVLLAEEGRARFDAAAAQVASERERMLQRLDAAVGPSTDTAVLGMASAALAGLAVALPGPRRQMQERETA